MNRDDIIRKYFDGKTPTSGQATNIMARVIGEFATVCIQKLTSPIAIARSWPDIPTEGVFFAVQDALAKEVAVEIHTSIQAAAASETRRNMGEITLTVHGVVLAFLLKRVNESLEALRMHPDLTTNPKVIVVEPDERKRP